MEPQSRIWPYTCPALMILVSLFVILAGCTGSGDTLPGGMAGPGGCTSRESCMAYCSQHPETCDQYCREHPDACAIAGTSGAGPGTAEVGVMGGGTSCNDDAVKEKMRERISRVVVTPPEQVRGINWMTKILPAGNPYPGYYYTIGTAFGPGVDRTRWSGEGSPLFSEGEFYCTFGYWDSTPKGKGATLGTETPASFDPSRYDMTLFCTNHSGVSQAAMIASLPPLTMSEDEARDYFYTIVKRSFLDIDGREIVRAGNMYQLMWQDSSDSHDQWVVQIGNGYINVGQGSVNYAETAYIASMQGRDPGTRWLYHGCRPCTGCGEWTVETVLNQDCTGETDCLGGLVCNDGNCMAPGSVQAAPASLTPSQRSGNTGAPGSSCSSPSDCASGLLCRDGICRIPSGPA